MTRHTLWIAGKFIGFYSRRIIAETEPFAEYLDFAPDFKVSLPRGRISYNWETGIFQQLDIHGNVAGTFHLREIYGL